MKKSKLLSAEFGPANLGYPFSTLFNRAEIVTPNDAPAEISFKLIDATALVLWGGTDISPSLYGQEPNEFCESGKLPSKRDLFEWKLIQHCVAHDIPIIGVCRGAQLLCAYDGGVLAQDIGGHGGAHSIMTLTGNGVPGEMWAAGDHHQMMLPKPHNVVLATTIEPLHQGFYIGERNVIVPIPTGYLEPEVVYFPKLKAIGFQPHPEWMPMTAEFVQWSLEQIETRLLNEKVTV